MPDDDIHSDEDNKEAFTIHLEEPDMRMNMLSKEVKS